MTTSAKSPAFVRRVSWRPSTAGRSRSSVSSTVAMCIAVGKTSFEDWPRLTSSFGCTGLLPPRPAPASSLARAATTSFAFMLVCVPEPVWKTTRGNSSSRAPSATSRAARAMSSALSCGSTPSSALARAAAHLTSPRAWISGGAKRKRAPPMGKCSSERWVCAPQYRSAGTRASPMLSVSILTSCASVIAALRSGLPVARHGTRSVPFHAPGPAGRKVAGAPSAVALRAGEPPCAPVARHLPPPASYLTVR